MRCALLLLALLGGCDRCGDVDRLTLAPHYPTSTPPEARVALALPTLAALTPAQLAVVERQLRASAEWSVTRERGHTYAFRRRRVDGVWQSGSNGFHSDFQAPAVVQTRVLLGLPGEYGFGVERGNLTRASASQPAAQLVLEQYMDQPGLQSYLVVRGGADVSLEVFEQAKATRRDFTAGAVREVEAQLAAIVAAAAEIRAQGYAAQLTPSGSVKRGPTPPMRVTDGFQGGLYEVEAWVNPGAEGVVFTRVVFTGEVRPEHRVPPELRGRGVTPLSVERVARASERLVGWGPDPAVTFRYQAGLTVYEGDWEHSYPARFEVWFRPSDGSAERKLAELTRDISGWQR